MGHEEFFATPPCPGSRSVEIKVAGRVENLATVRAVVAAIATQEPEGLALHSVEVHQGGGGDLGAFHRSEGERTHRASSEPGEHRKRAGAFDPVQAHVTTQHAAPPRVGSGVGQ